MKRIPTLFLLLFPVFLTLAAAAEDAEFDGYLLRLREERPVALYELPEGIAPVSPEAGVYQAETLEAAAGFAAPDELLYLEPNYYVTLFDDAAAAAPNDPRYPEQWALQMLEAEAARAAGLTGKGVRIGLIDSGICAEHEDLSGAKILTGYNFLTQSTDTTDDVGHGTFVAGIIAAVPDNGTGIAGLAPEAELVPLKCFSQKNSTIASITRAIREGVDRFQCDILNLSLGTSQKSTALQDAIDYAADNGVILIAAVGNTGSDTLNYPAAFENVIGVGMVDSTKEVAKNSQRNESVFAAAPGYRVLGLNVPAATGTAGPYRTGSGTSFASPHIAAMAALLKEQSPALTGEELMALLLLAAEDLGEPGRDTDYGYGLPALSELLRLAPELDALVPLRLTRKDENTLLIQGRCPFAEESVLFAADYWEAGRLRRCKKLSAEVFGSVLLVNESLAIGMDTEAVKLLFLNATTFAPRRPAAVWKP